MATRSARTAINGRYSITGVAAGPVTVSVRLVGYAPRALRLTVRAGETATAGYTFVDAHFAYHWDTPTLGWEVFADGTNLTDQAGRVHTSFLKDNVVLPGRGVAAGVRVFF
mgnify:CR=1 FL=1